jgi:hypothetical protein
LAKTKKVVRMPKASKKDTPKWDGWESWSGEQYHRFKQGAHRWYYDTFQTNDLLPAVWTWMSNNDYSNEEIQKVKSAPSYAVGPTGAILCNLLLSGMPDFNPKEDEYWQTLAGTTGNIKPVSDFIKKKISEAINRVEVVEEKKEEIKESKNIGEVYVPTIQDRIRESSLGMTEFIEQAIEDFMFNDKLNDFKGIQITNKLITLGCKQPHARVIQSFYLGQMEELKEVLNPPSTKNMSEEEKDYADQLKEGYAIYDRKKIKMLYDFLVAISASCDAVIAQSKANRKPRKISKKAPEQLVKKLKYKISDEKFAISSIEPHKLVGANCLVVFNCKTRKLGIYYTSVEDPTGAGRDGSGLGIKGTTIERFNEETSVACTLRKPMDQLQQVKDLNTRKKFENWFTKLSTTPVKMNGRINPETVLIAAY